MLGLQYDKIIMFNKKLSNSEVKLGNILLLVFIFTLIFLIPLLPETIRQRVNMSLFSIIFFLSIFTLKEKERRVIFFGALVAFITEWIAEIFDFTFLTYLSKIVNVIFFQYIVVRLIFQIAHRKKVDANVILSSVNSYLLLGLMFTMMVAILQLYDSNAYGFSTNSFREFLYFTFVTMSTLGYGDITPNTPIAKSLSILISVSGQLYIAIIIAMLVGKFASTLSNKTE